MAIINPKQLAPESHPECFANMYFQNELISSKREESYKAYKMFILVLVFYLLFVSFVTCKDLLKKKSKSNK